MTSKLMRSMLGLLVSALVACAGKGGGTGGSESNVNAGPPSGAVGLPLPPGGAESITVDNWEKDARVVEILAVVKGIQADVASGKLKKSHKDLCADQMGESYREKVVDGTNRVRELVFSGGGEDSVTTSTYDFDAQGDLRYVFTVENRIGRLDNNPEHNTFTV